MQALLFVFFRSGARTTVGCGPFSAPVCEVQRALRARATCGSRWAGRVLLKAHISRGPACGGGRTEMGGQPQV